MAPESPTARQVAKQILDHQRAALVAGARAWRREMRHQRATRRGSRTAAAELALARRPEPEPAAQPERTPASETPSAAAPASAAEVSRWLLAGPAATADANGHAPATPPGPPAASAQISPAPVPPAAQRWLLSAGQPRPADPVPAPVPAAEPEERVSRWVAKAPPAVTAAALPPLAVPALGSPFWLPRASLPFAPAIEEPAEPDASAGRQAPA